jgi:hypothetical protein
MERAIMIYQIYYPDGRVFYAETLLFQRDEFLY